MTDALISSDHHMLESNLYIDYGITFDTKDQVQYKSHSVAVMYSKNNINKLSLVDNMIDPLFPGT